MDFNLTDEQELIVASYRDYMESENWETYFHECDEKHEYPLRWAQGLCEMGFDRIMLDEEHGGLGLEQPITTLMAIYEVLGQYGAPTYVLYSADRLQHHRPRGHSGADRCLPEVPGHRRAGL